MGLIWLRTPTTWHSTRVDRANAFNYSAMTPEEATMITAKFTFWYEADWDYGHPTVIFFCVAIALAIILRVIFALRNGKTSARTQVNLVDRGAAFVRYTVARQYRIPRFHWYSPPLAAIIAVSSIFIFTMGLMLGPRPYYWPNVHVMGHSPPIATRSGWLSIAIMPFMIAFATKVNWIGALAGTSHEKLQVFHRWTALIMYITSLVHTFPFIVQSIQLGEMEANWSTTPWYWSGVAALVPQTYLVFLSWGIFRNKYYETFKKLHFIAAGIFMAALFVHCNFRLTSWDYFAATAAIWFTVLCFRHFRTIYNTGLLGVPATLEALPDGMMKLTVQTPSRVKWTPGQHVLVRVLNSGIHAFSSHPFTVSSLHEDGHLELVFKVHGGITLKLASMVSGKPSRSVRVAIDGPYGGVPSLKGYDHVYLLAGGAGITLTLPLLKQLIRDGASGVDFLLAVKRRETAAWLQESLAGAKAAGVTTHVHVTGSSEQGGPEHLKTDEEGSPSSSVQDLKHPEDVVLGRPDLPAIVHKAVKSHKGRIAIIACGPESFLYDVRNTVAECQLVLADGYGTCTDLFLHTENYSW
ncbi:hypothetical protein VNI00_002202 [Paramarasmius palmivorus]|uniref:ferric-chelate reductase (NADPH) n=1 Tax=Paramarasmius palmivorus TaxID=297713 RepID=A0AAW0E0P6_9AGAR